MSPLGGGGGPGVGAAVGRDCDPEQQHCLHAGGGDGVKTVCSLLEGDSYTDNILSGGLRCKEQLQGENSHCNCGILKMLPKL